MFVFFSATRNTLRFPLRTNNLISEVVGSEATKLNIRILKFLYSARNWKLYCAKHEFLRNVNYFLFNVNLF